MPRIVLFLSLSASWARQDECLLQLKSHVGTQLGSGTAESGSGVGGTQSIGCAENIDDGRWILVRHTAPGSTWGPFTDNLMGTDDIAKPSGPESTTSWTVPFSRSPTTEVLFSLGDCSQWLITTFDAVNGENYANELRNILKSSLSPSQPYVAYWYNRKTHEEDPLISVGHHSWKNGRTMLYGENSYWQHTALMEAHKGSNVFIRDTT